MLLEIMPWLFCEWYKSDSQHDLKIRIDRLYNASTKRMSAAFPQGYREIWQSSFILRLNSLLIYGCLKS